MIEIKRLPIMLDVEDVTGVDVQSPMPAIKFHSRHRAVIRQLVSVILGHEIRTYGIMPGTSIQTLQESQ